MGTTLLRPTNDGTIDKMADGGSERCIEIIEFSQKQVICTPTAFESRWLSC